MLKNVKYISAEINLKNLDTLLDEKCGWGENDEISRGVWGV